MSRVKVNICVCMYDVMCDTPNYVYLVCKVLFSGSRSIFQTVNFYFSFLFKASSIFHI